MRHVRNAGASGFDDQEDGSTRRDGSSPAMTLPVTSATKHTPLLERAFERLPLPSYLPKVVAPTPSQQLADLEAVRSAMLARTPERTARVRELNDPERVFAGLVREYAQHAGALEGTRAAWKVGSAMARATLSSFAIKARNDVPRPFILDRTVAHPPGTPPITSLDGEPLGTSFPSSHAANAYAATTVLAELWPQRAAEFARLAGEMAQARVYSGVHSPSDVAAGKEIGTAIGRHVIGATG